MKATASACQRVYDRNEASREQQSINNGQDCLEKEVRSALTASEGTGNRIGSRVTRLKNFGKEVSRYPRRAKDKVVATATGKRRKTMGHPAIAVHEDAPTLDNNAQPRRLRRMSTHDTVRHIQEDESVQDDYVSDETDSDDEPDESVVEDMRKLEESFAGISQRYRLINRIGEGQQRFAFCPSHSD